MMAVLVAAGSCWLLVLLADGCLLCCVMGACYVVASQIFQMLLHVGLGCVHCCMLVMSMCIAVLVLGHLHWI